MEKLSGWNTQKQRLISESFIEVTRHWHISIMGTLASKNLECIYSSKPIQVKIGSIGKGTKIIVDALLLNKGL